MAQKRVAERQLTQDNWDDDEEQPDAEDGKFTPADPHVLANRKIRTALRRRQNTPQQEPEKKGIFSSFGGFGTKTSSSTSTPSFNFISNLINKNSDNSKSDNFSFMSNPSTTLNAEKSTGNTNTFNLGKEKEKANPLKMNETKINTLENPVLEKNDEYYVNLKSLNISVSEWIKSHVDKNPYCILTPIFDDYINHLKELEKLKQISSTDKNTPTKEKTFTPTNTNVIDKIDKTQTSKKLDEAIKNNVDATKNNVSSLFNNPVSSTPSIFSMQPNSDTSKAKSPTSTFGQGFSSTPISKAPMFSFGQKTDTPTTTPFSFGTGKPFTFGNMPAKEPAPPPKPDEENEEDEPPTVMFTPVVEEDNVYSKRCKVFVKKNDNFGDRGVGTLYLKPIANSEKYQMIVRADTSLGNLLLNLVLSDIPMQRMGKNNVMLVCIPTGDSSTPVPTLLRVKTAEEADELLETLNKYKK